MEFRDCFAYQNDRCTALKNKDCENCNFYRVDLNTKNIEKECEEYQGGSRKGHF